MGRLVKCSFCEAQVDKSQSERYKDKNYHPECLEKLEQRMALMTYVCLLFGLKGPGPVIYSQLKNFLEKYPHYTYEGILDALRYFYEVKKNSIKNSNQAIGIVPHVYDEAQIYYKKVTYKQEKIAENLERQINQKPIIVQVNKIEKKEKFTYNLEELTELEE